MSRADGDGRDPFAFLDRIDVELRRVDEPSVPEACFESLGPEVVIGGTWRLKTRIGRGGFGVVFEAERVDDPALVVAIKVMSPEPAADERWARRFEQEARITTALRHPHVVRTRAHGRLEDGAFFLVMDWIEGETLRDRLASGRGLPWPEIAAMLEQLGSALGEVHAAGIVHRDVKPSNVLLLDTDASLVHAVLVDFGVCKGPAALTASREQMGTAPYLAPEVLRAGAREATAQVDVYGLALLAYEMVTGVRAFAAPSVAPLVARIIAGAPPRPISELRPAAPLALVEWIGRGMARDPKARPQDVVEYGRALAAAAGGC